MTLQSGDYIRMGHLAGRDIEWPIRLMPMPHWPGAKRAVELAIAGAPFMAVGFDCFDRSSIALEYVLEQRDDVPTDVSEALNGYPLLSIICVDHGIGVKEINGLPARTSPNDAERYVSEIQKLLGKDKPTAVIGAGLNLTDTVRRYFWKVEA